MLETFPVGHLPPEAGVTEILQPEIRERRGGGGQGPYIRGLSQLLAGIPSQPRTDGSKLPESDRIDGAPGVGANTEGEEFV